METNLTFSMSTLIHPTDMFKIEITEKYFSITVKYKDTNNDFVVVANGRFAIDVANRSTLVIITHITISSGDTWLLSRFISEVIYLSIRIYMSQY